MFKTLLSLSLTTLIANTASAYTIPRNADSFGQLVEFAVNAVKNDVQFDSICSSYKCEPTTTWRYGYKAYIYNNLVDLYFDLTGHLVEVRITDIPIDISRKVNSSLHKMLSNDKDSFEVPYDYLNKGPGFQNSLNRYFFDNVEVNLTEERIDTFSLSIQTSYENSRKRVEKLISTDKNLQLHVTLGRNGSSVNIVPGITRIKDLRAPVYDEHTDYGKPEFRIVPIMVSGSFYSLRVPYTSDLILAIDKRVYSDDDPSEKLTKQEDMLRVFNDTLDRNKNLLKPKGLFLTTISYYCINGSTGLGCINKYQGEKDQFPDRVLIEAPESIEKNEKFIFNREKFRKLIQRGKNDALIPTDKHGFLQCSKQ